MTSRRSSGSMRAERAVEPTRSQNITVSWRRSVEDTGGAYPGGAGAGNGETGALSGPSLKPHSGQNFAAPGKACPQAGQARSNGAPHSMQNLPPSGTSTRQLGHSMPVLTVRDGQPITGATNTAYRLGQTHSSLTPSPGAWPGQ